MSLFIDSTTRTAAEVMADLIACRQLRHFTEQQRQDAITDTYEWLAECWMGREAIKHPDPTNPCKQCGTPRAKFSVGGSGLCFRCYGARGPQERKLWVEDVFCTAIARHGFVCDACGDISTLNNDEGRIAASWMIDNMNGFVRPCLCFPCTSDFKSFCSRRFYQGAWRAASKRHLEKMALAWLGQKVKKLAERVADGVAP